MCIYIYIYLEPRTTLFLGGYSKEWHSLIRGPFFNKSTFFLDLPIIQDEGSFDVQGYNFRGCPDRTLRVKAIWFKDEGLFESLCGPIGPICRLPLKGTPPAQALQDMAK